jgi:hypothetical protein
MGIMDPQLARHLLAFLGLLDCGLEDVTRLKLQQAFAESTACVRRSVVDDPEARLAMIRALQDAFTLLQEFSVMPGDHKQDDLKRACVRAFLLDTKGGSYAKFCEWQLTRCHGECRYLRITPKKFKSLAVESLRPSKPSLLRRPNGS